MSRTFARLFYGILLLIPLLGVTKGQIPPIGIIDFYGLRSISEQQIRQALQIKEGDQFPESGKEIIKKRLEALPNVEEVSLNFGCCEAGKSVLYIGIREKGSSPLQFRASPTGAIRLPEIIVKTGQEFENALTEAVLKGDAVEDDSQGHALFNNAKVHQIQEQYLILANQYLKELRAVIRHSAYPAHRALAVQIIAYHKNKAEIVKDLIFGMSDADSNVRNNAMRALGVLAVFARKNRSKQIKVPVEPFIKMLNSIEWTDRNKASLALFRLTEDRNQTILLKLRNQAFGSLAEMARWKSVGHAYSSFTILGRIGSFSEEEIAKALSSEDREAFIKTILVRINGSL